MELFQTNPSFILSRHPVIVDGQFQYEASLTGICGTQIRTETDFLYVLRFSSVVIIPYMRYVIIHPSPTP
jgi:hypothetical protein